jgi:hypothetical protein
MVGRESWVPGFRALALSLLLSVVALVAACGNSAGEPRTLGFGADGSAGDACIPGDANGMLAVRVVGAPPGGGVVVISGSLYPNVVGEVDVMGRGAFTVNAAPVAEALTTPPQAVRAAFAPSIDNPDPCLRSGQTTTVTVTYTPIPTSGHLWVGSSGGGNETLGYASVDLEVSGSPAPSVVADGIGDGAFTFDQLGNMWAVLGTASGPSLARFPASTFDTSGAKTPDITVTSSSLGTAAPGAGICFDPQGNLWVAVAPAGKVIELTAAQIAASGSAKATTEIGGFNAPSGICFDAFDNLFLASNGDGSVARVDARRVNGPSSDGADLTVTANTSGPGSTALKNPTGIVLDTAGNLWVNFNGTIAMLTPNDLSGTGAKKVTPTVQIATDALSPPLGLAFDQQGGLWLGYKTGELARLAPAQLGASASVIPQTVIGGPDIVSVGWLALYPVPTDAQFY